MVRRNGFTLIELVAVLMIMSLALGVAAPTLRGFTENGKLRDATQSMLAACTWARSRATADAVAYRLVIENDTYRVQQVVDNQAADIDGEFGRVTTLPQGFTVEAKIDGGNAIDFLPDGRSTPATITLTAPSGNTQQLACLGPAETFQWVKTP